MKQLYAASQRFPDNMIQTKQGASYVDHAVITQRLMQVFGWFDQEIAEVIRGPVPAWKTPGDPKYKPPLEDVVTGCVLRITVHTEQGVRTVEEVGMVEFPHNHDQDGSRLKFAVSDAIKRCAMRLGVGLHLWAQGLYTLDTFTRRMLEEAKQEADGAEVPEAPNPQQQPTDPDAPVVPETAEAEAVAPTPEPVAEPAEEMPYAEPDPDAVKREAELRQVLASLDPRFVATLDVEAMVEFGSRSDETMVKALETVQQRRDRWSAAQEGAGGGEDTPEASAPVSERSDATCGGTTKAGKPCSNPPGDDGYCHLHGPDEAPVEDAVVVSDEEAAPLPDRVTIYGMTFMIPPRDYYEGGETRARVRAHEFADHLIALDGSEEFAKHLDAEGVLGKSVQFVATSDENLGKALERLRLRHEHWVGGVR